MIPLFVASWIAFFVRRTIVIHVFHATQRIPFPHAGSCEPCVVRIPSQNQPHRTAIRINPSEPFQNDGHSPLFAISDGFANLLLKAVYIDIIVSIPCIFVKFHNQKNYLSIIHTYGIRSSHYSGKIPYEQPSISGKIPCRAALVSRKIARAWIHHSTDPSGPAASLLSPPDSSRCPCSSSAGSGAPPPLTYDCDPSGAFASWIVFFLFASCRRHHRALPAPPVQLMHHHIKGTNSSCTRSGIALTTPSATPSLSFAHGRSKQQHRKGRHHIFILVLRTAAFRIFITAHHHPLPIRSAAPLRPVRRLYIRQRHHNHFAPADFGCFRVIAFGKYYYYTCHLYPPFFL